MHDLRDPLLKNVVQRVRRVDSEANQDDVRVGVGEGSETVIIFLSSRIPQGQLDVLVVDLDIGDVVLEDGRDVDLRESALGEDNQQTGFTAGTVADDDELSADLSHGVCEALREREMEEAAGWRWEGRVLRWWLMAVVDGMKGRSRKTDVRSRSRAEEIGRAHV